MSRFFYNIKQAFIQMGRNKGMAAASFFAITAMMLILGLFFTISVNVNLFSEVVKQDYDSVELFLKDNITADETNAIIADAKALPGVTSVSYRTKEQAMQIMKERWGDSGYLLDSLSDNPLPNSVLVKVEGVEAADNVNKYAGTKSGIEDTKYYKETVDRLTAFMKYLQLGIMVIMAFLIVISVVVVSNTIRLTVFARANEISIMKYIGATNWFIRGPFLVEGIMIGVISSLISVAISYFIYSGIVDAIGSKVMVILSSPLISPQYLITNLMIIFLAIGVGVGACGSIISMRKFLDA